jgi:Transposase DDE domain
MLTPSNPSRRPTTPVVSPARVSDFASQVFGEALHKKRVDSVANATLGVLQAASLAVSTIGEGLAISKGLHSKHAIKQVDRLFSNRGLDPNLLFASWVPFILAERLEIVVVLDWTDFDKDDHSTLALSLVTSHGRSTPLLWKTVHKSKLAKRRNDFEDALLHRLREVIPDGVRTTILCDRGFADKKLYEYLKTELGFDYIIRFRSSILVTDANGQTRAAKDLIPKSPRTLKLRGARVTKDGYEVGAVVLVHDRDMKEAWCLATSRTDLTGAQVVALYGKRFTAEETFRDQKDLRFGMGLSSTRIKDPKRRDRVLLVCAMATALLTLLGAAGESLGEDRMLKANTVKTRTHSLLRQGSYYFAAMPNWPEERSARLLARFALLLSQNPFCRQIFGII